jgi:vanadium chloroperoxidase
MRFWIDTALECVRRDHTPAFGSGDQRGPFFTARALGMALGALHDGHALASAKLLSFPAPVPPAVSANATVAAAEAEIAGAAACHRLLLHRYPQQAQALNAAWDFWRGLYPVPSAANVAAFERYGREIGDAIDLLGVNDRQAGRMNGYQPGGIFSHDEPPHETGQGFAGSEWGDAAMGASRLVTAAIVPNFARPPGRTGPLPADVVPNTHFADDFRKVQAKGAKDKRARTEDEEVIGIFWGYDGPPELGTPPRLYLQVVLAVLDEIQARNPNGLSPAEELQIIAATGLAMADAGIDAWHYKYSADHMMWRPVLGVPHGLGSLAAPEPGWLPLGRPDTNGSGETLTPNFPAYPSGHATFGAAAFQLLRTYLVHKGLANFLANGRDNVRFCCMSDEFDGRNREPRLPREPRPKLLRAYSSLWDAITDNSLSRVFLGVHWQFDGITVKGTDPDGEFGVPSSPAQLGRRGGVWLGCQIANEVAARIGVAPATIAASRA